jgi:hypothetical protein
MAARGGVRGVRGTRASTRGTRGTSRAGTRTFISSSMYESTNLSLCSPSCGKPFWEYYYHLGWRSIQVACCHWQSIICGGVDEGIISTQLSSPYSCWIPFALEAISQWPGFDICFGTPPLRLVMALTLTQYSILQVYNPDEGCLHICQAHDRRCISTRAHRPPGPHLVPGGLYCSKLLVVYGRLQSKPPCLVDGDDLHNL